MEIKPGRLPGAVVGAGGVIAGAGLRLVGGKKKIRVVGQNVEMHTFFSHEAEQRVSRTDGQAHKMLSEDPGGDH